MTVRVFGIGRLGAAEFTSGSTPVKREAESISAQSELGQVALTLADEIFGPPHTRSFSIELWDGTFVGAPASRFTLRITTPFALRAALAPPLDLRPGEAFAHRWLDVDGDLEAAVDAFLRATAVVDPLRAARVAALMLRLPGPPRDASHHRLQRGRRHSKTRDRDSVRSHYDRPLDLYRAFLGPALVYSCGYWDDASEDLATAQEAKMDHVLRKLQLGAGETFLDIGCGWGALVIRAAERFGARCVGITLSREQYAEARRRITERGLGERCRIELCDYRELANVSFDKIASIGMIEHVGRENLCDYFASVWRVLEPGGLFLNHGIGDLSERRRGTRATGFIARYVFPDGDLPPLTDVIAGAESCGFEVRDVEDLREHYTKTLRAWYENLIDHRDEARSAVGDFLYRVWCLYVAGSAQGFASGRLAVYQALLSKARADGSSSVLPTRAHLYAP